MNRICFVVFVAAALGIAGRCLLSVEAGELQAPARTKWEYKAISQSEVDRLVPKKSKDSLTDGLNVLGAEGWELVAVQTSIPSGNPMMAGSSSTYLFKRSK